MPLGKIPSNLKKLYQEQGYYCPLPVLSLAQTKEFRECFDNFYESNKLRLQSLAPRDQYQVLSETHLSFPWVYRLAVHSQVLDAVEQILGPDLLIWGSRWFTKMPGDKTFITWHQDATYWNLHPPKVTTAWIALTYSGPHNGCMRVVPRSHTAGLLPQTETFAADNALSRGQEIAVDVDEQRAQDIVLRPGEMSLHHIGIVHGSKVNTSIYPRIGIAIRYISPEVKQDVDEKPIAVLARGSDRYGNFELLRPPENTGVALEQVHSIAVRRMMNSVLPRKGSPAK